MNYLLYGLESFLIEKEIKNIINKHKIEEINISKFDLEINSIKEILESANTISLFSSNKLLIVQNSFIFSRTTNKKKDDIGLLEEYLKHKNEDVIIVFIDNNEKIDSIKKIVKLLKETGKIIECNKLKSVNEIAKKMFDDYNVEQDVINILVNRVGNNLNILYNEIEKLKIYKINEKIITKEDVINLIADSTSVDIFKFIDDIINKNKTDALIAYKKLLKLNEEPIKIIALLASKFRLMYQSSTLTKKGYTEDQISEILDVHRYPVHLSIVAGYKYNPKILVKYLNDLAELDIGIKTGEKDKELALELFILSL